jgi:ATP-dependent DNA helicase RecG
MKYLEDFIKSNNSTILDLALLLPIDYKNNILSPKIKLKELNTFAVTISRKYLKSRVLVVRFYIFDLDQTVTGVFFNAIPYFNRLLDENGVFYIQGVVQKYRGYYQIIQPKILKREDIEKVVPIYSKNAKINRKLLEAFRDIKDEFKEKLNSTKLTSREKSSLFFAHYPRDIYDTKIDIKILKVVEAINHLEKLSKKKTTFKAIESLNGDIKEFIKELPFKLTNDQKKAISDIRKDLNSKKATRRLIIGDVGSGKTMVILASAVMAYPKKSILMAPTSILAVQLYQEAQKFLPKHIKVELVKQGVKSDLDADFIIGTHALLYRENLPTAPLIMIDEQHRFGTKQRALLEKLVSSKDKKPHFLQFSATPIPRTQAMMLSKLIDVTLIEEIPFKKRIDTKIIGRRDFPKLLDKIKEEISKNHQVLIVYPLVEESSSIPYQSIDEGREFWESRFEKVYITHGKDREKEEVLLKFREDGNILLATTVIEVGISLPRLTLIVIVGAERLGLATLHQLRGRVGRLGLESFCYLFTNDTENKRLKAFSKTTNGFDIAKLDLKFRNAGDILDGTIQSGVKFRWLNLAEDEDIIEEAKKRVQ